MTYDSYKIRLKYTCTCYQIGRQVYKYISCNRWVGWGWGGYDTRIRISLKKNE